MATNRASDVLEAESTDVQHKADKPAVPDVGTLVQVLWASSKEEEEESDTDCDAEEDLNSDSDNDDDTVLRWCTATVQPSGLKDALPTQRLLIYVKEAGEDTGSHEDEANNGDTADCEEVVFLSRDTLVLLSDYDADAPLDSYSETALTWRYEGEASEEEEEEEGDRQGGVHNAKIAELLHEALGSMNPDEMWPDQSDENKRLAAEFIAEQIDSGALTEQLRTVVDAINQRATAEGKSASDVDLVREVLLQQEGLKEAVQQKHRNKRQKTDDVLGNPE